VIVPTKELVEAMDNDTKGVSDLLQLENMHEASILDTLRQRHKRNQCYVHFRKKSNNVPWF